VGDGQRGARMLGCAKRSGSAASRSSSFASETSSARLSPRTDDGAAPPSSPTVLQRGTSLSENNPYTRSPARTASAVRARKEAHAALSSRRKTTTPTVQPMWDRHQLDSTWSEIKQKYCGKRGKITRLDKIGSQVEIEFRDGNKITRLAYPIDAVGLRGSAGDIGQPLEDASVLLTKTAAEVEGDEGLVVEVRDDVAFVQQCFTGNNTTQITVG
jgi:hypothetical protein